MLSRRQLRVLSLFLISAAVLLPCFGLLYHTLARNFNGPHLFNTQQPRTLSSMRPDGLPPHGFEMPLSELQDGPFLRHVAVVGSIEIGFAEWYLGKREPFIVRACKEFANVTKKSLVTSVLQSNGTLESYLSEKDDAADLSPAAAIKHWESGKDILIIDAPVDDLIRIPNRLSTYNGYGGLMAYDKKMFGESSARRDVSIQLASSGYYSALHSDPPDMGGGWVYAADGEKDWVYLPPAYLHHARSMDLAIMENGTIHDLLGLSKRMLGSAQRRRDYSLHRSLSSSSSSSIPPPKFSHKLSKEEERDDKLPFNDKIYPIHLATLKKGDFICWPPGWMHKVHTTKPFIGLGSYILLPEDREELDKGLWSAIAWCRGELQHPWGHYEYGPPHSGTRRGTAHYADGDYGRRTT